MIDDLKTANYVSDLFLDVNGRLNESIAKVQGSCSPADFEDYKRRVGRLINSIFEDILEPIYRKHPDLKPSELEL